MKHDEQVDELFRKGFNPNLSEEIPGDFLSDINQRLDQLEQRKSKKRTPVFWWVAGIFSLVGVILFTYSFTQPQRIQITSTSKKNTDQPKKFISTSKQQLPQNQAINLIQNSSTRIFKKSQNNSFELENLAKINPQTRDNQKQINKTNDQLNNSENQHFKNKSSVGTLSQNEVQKTDISNASMEVVTSVDSLITLEETIDTLSVINEISLQESSNDSNSNSKIKDSIPNVLSTEKNKVIEVDSNEKNKIQYSLSFYSGVSSIFHQVLAPDSYVAMANSISPINYREKRTMEEKSITSWDMAMRFGMQFKKFTMSTGIDYFVWGERTDYSNVSYESQYQNTYRYLNIPLLIGYQIQKGTFGIQPSLGLSMGFLANQVSGFYLNSNNATSSYQANINKFTGTLHAGCELAYFSQSGIKVSVSPIVRTSLIKVVQSDLARNRYSSLGFQLGIGYRW
jgi:hypothetical protein